MELTVAERSEVFAMGVEAVNTMAELCHTNGIATPHSLYDTRRGWTVLHDELAGYLSLPRERRLEGCRAAVELLTAACELNRRALLDMRAACATHVTEVRG